MAHPLITNNNILKRNIKGLDKTFQEMMFISRLVDKKIDSRFELYIFHVPNFKYYVGLVDYKDGKDLILVIHNLINTGDPYSPEKNEDYVSYTETKKYGEIFKESFDRRIRQQKIISL